MRDKYKNIIFVFLFILICSIGNAIEILPSAKGNKWEYESYKIIKASISHDNNVIATLNDVAYGSSIYKITDKSGDNPVIWEYVEETKMDSPSGVSDSSKATIKYSYKNEKMVLHEITTISGTDKKTETQTYKPPLVYFDSSFKIGDKWDVGEIRDGDTTTFLQAEIVGMEDVKVPAGTFNNCVRVVYHSNKIAGTINMWDSEFKIKDAKSRSVYWIAEGVGVVKELEVYTSTSESEGPDGKPIILKTATCVVSELSPGYIVKK